MANNVARALYLDHGILTPECCGVATVYLDVSHGCATFFTGPMPATKEIGSQVGSFDWISNDICIACCFYENYIFLDKHSLL
jgi:hypothetical protein